MIVDGMLKLIDFGIANQMQPDTTSIVKDSQVGVLLSWLYFSVLNQGFASGFCIT